MLVELIRHGLTKSNLERRYLGLTDEPLSVQGKKALIKAQYSCPAVYVTKLCRTSETASILFPGASRIVVNGLEEMDFGRFDGKTGEEMAEDRDYIRWVEGGCRSRCPGGEDKKSFCTRVTTAFDALLTEAFRKGEKEVRIVCHGGTIMAVMERYASEKKDYFSWNRPCGCGYLLDAGDWKREKTLSVMEMTDYRAE
ncbi:MAG: histidine phosphatase family protein [Lachnospiraceae bacterium]|nr:histidine phosphatase family protein [Lachnospiraceae bacterium]